MKRKRRDVKRKNDEEAKTGKIPQYCVRFAYTPPDKKKKKGRNS